MTRSKLALLLAVTLVTAACGGGDASTGSAADVTGSDDGPAVTFNPVAGVASDEALGARYVGTGTVTLSTRTVANECSGPVDVTLVIPESGFAHLTLSYLIPMSDKIVVGEELRFVCVEDGEPMTLDYRAEAVDGRYVFEPEGLVSGAVEAIVDTDGASVSGQVLGGSNVWDFSIERLVPTE